MGAFRTVAMKGECATTFCSIRNDANSNTNTKISTKYDIMMLQVKRGCYMKAKQIHSKHPKNTHEENKCDRVTLHLLKGSPPGL